MLTVQGLDIGLQGLASTHTTILAQLQLWHRTLSDKCTNRIIADARPLRTASTALNQTLQTAVIAMWRTSVQCASLLRKQSQPIKDKLMKPYLSLMTSASSWLCSCSSFDLSGTLLVRLNFHVSGKDNQSDAYKHGSRQVETSHIHADTARLQIEHLGQQLAEQQQELVQLRAEQRDTATAQA